MCSVALVNEVEAGIDALAKDRIDVMSAGRWAMGSKRGGR